MGSWEVGLYSGDFAMDLRSAIRAVSRLPFDSDRLVDILCEFEAAAAGNPNDEDYTTFWLVVADQFARRGIVSARARETAREIIDAGVDLEMQRKRGQSAAGLAKRSRLLEELRARIVGAKTEGKPRTVLRAPEPFVMDVGDALVYPLCGRKCLNPYVVRRDKQIVYGPAGPQPWTQDGWGAMVVGERGRAFGFFAWYRPLVIGRALKTRPALDELKEEQWRLELAGNCPPVQFRRMELERLGGFPITVDALHGVFPALRPGDRMAIADISIGNRLSIRNLDRSSGPRGPGERIVRIDELSSHRHAGPQPPIT